MKVRWIASAALSGGLLLLASTVVLPRFGDQAPAQVEQQATIAPSPAQAEALRMEAARLQRCNKIYGAIARLEQATELDPTSADLHKELANLHLQLKDYPAAIESLIAAHGQDPEDLNVLQSLGVAYMHTGEAEASAQVLAAVAEFQPADAAVRFYLGNAYLLMGEDEQAVQAFEAAIERFEHFWPAINNIGLIEYERGNVEQAKQLWWQASAIAGSGAEPKLALATALYQQGRTGLAEALASEAIWMEAEYSQAEYQKYHLWGDQLIEDAKAVLQTDSVQSVLESMPQGYGDE